mgnify:CR=1 FL=1
MHLLMVNGRNDYIINFIFIRAFRSMNAIPNYICERFYAVMLACGNSKACWRMNN